MADDFGFLTLHQWCVSQDAQSPARWRRRPALSKKKSSNASHALSLVHSSVRNAARRMAMEGARTLTNLSGRPLRLDNQKHHPDSRAARAQAAGIEESTQKRLDYIQRRKPDWLLEIANGKRAVYSSYSELRSKDQLLEESAQQGWNVNSLKADLIQFCEQIHRISYEALPLTSKVIGDTDLITVKSEVGNSAPIIYVIAATRSQLDRLISSKHGEALRLLGGKIYFAIPAGVADRFDVPATCGLMIRESDHWRCEKAGRALFDNLIPEVLLAMFKQSTQSLKASIEHDIDVSM